MNTRTSNKVSFQDFLVKFPVIDLPITLGSDLHHIFSQKNDPFNPLEIKELIEPIEGKEADEFTEFIPCFAIPDTEYFFGLVYWKAGLLDYQYRLVTFSKKGELLHNRVIAGVYSDGDSVLQSVATIDSDWTIHIVTGQASATGDQYDAAHSKAIEIELYPDGFIGEEVEE